jgi:RHS repeat-associated protein
MYDVAANRTLELVGATTTTSTLNSVNEITSHSGGVNRTLTYDSNGSLINDGLTRTFEWDGANRLVAVNYTGTNTRSEFSYDGLSRLAKIVERTGKRTTSTRKFVWCGMEQCEFRDANDSVTLYIYPQGEYSGNKAYFYSRDHLGSIREMRKSNDMVVARYDYDPYGRRTKLSGGLDADFGFTGHYYHQPSGLHLPLYRAYDADLGRWISRDPIAERGGINLYQYVFNNPVVFVDLLGLQTPGPAPTPTPAPPGFHWYGNWGGPGWANGGWNRESGPLPNRGDPNYVTPIDERDRCYEQHDRCIHNSPSSPDHGNGCVRQCDHELHDCLNRLTNKTIGSRFDSWLFGGPIPWLVH